MTLIGITRRSLTWSLKRIARTTLVLSLLGALFTIPLVSAFTLAKEDKRQKVIDFEDEVVEGMNKRPFDSLAQISEAEKRRRKSHLYRKRAGFRSETAESLRVIKYAP